MIRVDEISKYYGAVKALDRVTFEIAKGEIVGVLGPNGAGKSTLLRILTSYLAASSGTASVGGFDVMNQSDEVRRNIGYLPQAVPIYPEMRVDEYLTYRAKLKSVDRSKRDARIDYCLERCRCREVRRRLIGTLSNGYRQRVGLADALLHDPPVLILDEPTAGLDPLQIRETLATIGGLAGQHTVLLSTHILSEVESVCQRVIIINRGRIGLDSKLSELGGDVGLVTLEIRGPADAITAALKSLDGVDGVTHRALADGIVGIEVRVKSGKDMREAVYHAVAKHPNWALRKLDQRRRRLEDHFVDVVVRGDNRPPTALSA